jgi:hypothetical protein
VTLSVDAIRRELEEIADRLECARSDSEQFANANAKPLTTGLVAYEHVVVRCDVAAIRIRALLTILKGT